MVAPANPEFCGKLTALPERVIGPFWGTIRVFAGALPVKNLYIHQNDNGEVAHCTWVESGIETLVAPVMLRPGGESGPFVAHSASVRTPPGSAVAVWPSILT